MPMDRTALQKMLTEAKANRGSGKIQFIKAGKPVRLRILEFVDNNGAVQFSRLKADWQKGQDKNSQILNRQLTLGAPDAPTRLRELCDSGGVEFPYSKLRKQYLVNGIDIDAHPPQVRVWGLPTTAWESLVELMLSDQWADVLDPKSGHPLIITRTGQGLETEYHLAPDRLPWPVSPTLFKQITDPITVIQDPGVVKQCELMNCTIEELFGADADNLTDLEPIEFEQPKAVAPPAKSSAPPNTSRVVPSARSVGLPVKVARQAPVETEVPDEPVLENDDQQDMFEESEPPADETRLPGRAPVRTAPIAGRTSNPATAGQSTDVSSLVRGILGGGKK